MSEELKDGRERVKKIERTPESALAEFQQAYESWKSQESEDRFSINWLQRNGFSMLYYWALDNGGIKALVAQSSEEIQGAFKEPKRRSNPFTKEDVVRKFQEAYAKWLSLPTQSRGDFNVAWLWKNDFAGAYNWARKRYPGGLEGFMSTELSEEIKAAFETRSEVGYTLETGLSKLEQAYQQWKTSQIEDGSDRGDFNANWLMHNGFVGLYEWANKNFENFSGLVSQAPEHIRAAFKRQKDAYTEEIALKKLEEAHRKWLSIPESDRGRFTGYWLTRNGFGQLDNWARAGGWLDFIKKAPEEIRQDFERVRNSYSLESALEKLREDFSFWKNLPELNKPSFGPGWINKRSNGLFNWASSELGGIDELVRRSDPDIQAAFQRHGAREMSKAQTESAHQAIKEISLRESDLAQNFFSNLSLFGSSRYLDILYKLHPDFKALPPEKVKGIAAEYLGDFLVVKGEFRAGSLKEAVPFLSDTTFREGLYETIKDDCLRFYYQKKREGVAQDGHKIISEYIDHIVAEVDSVELDSILNEVGIFYESALVEFQKPTAFVDRLSEGRDFPDINQRVNMKELKDKKRLLIADEMGLGKSASVIMAKEQMGVKCAVVIAPSNVLETWKRYLSDDVEQGGYFQIGQAPRVLFVDSPSALEGVSAEQYDYVLISQEKMNERYVPALKAMRYDMVVVDEVHKMKNLEGSRTEQLLEITKEIQGDDKYLALLSGTPVPNKVEDVALSLKLLHPEKFADVDNKELVQQIIKGDLLDLRSELLPRMQMKKLEDSVEMPALDKKTQYVELEGVEKEIYEVLLEDDELTATEKMNILMKYVLNPELIDPTPGIPGAKVEALGKTLADSFTRHQKVLVFVNQFVENVIRGDGSIISKLNLPADVQVRIVHGGVAPAEREQIQREFQSGAGKILLIVSGQTADVGVDYSSAEAVIHYNEPWTEYDKRQQIARAYRPGLKHPLETTTLLTRGTIEEGIHQYIERKYRAIEKLLQGIPITELERELL